MSRPISKVRFDARRHLKGKSPEVLRNYLVRQAVKLLAADQELLDQGHLSDLSPTLRRLLTIFVMTRRKA